MRLYLLRLSSYGTKMVFLWCIVVVLASNLQAQPTSEITVAVAASLMAPFQQVEQAFEKQHSEVAMTLVAASSGKLTAQIINGAPYDIFVAADMHYPTQLYRQQHTRRPPAVLMRGRLVFWSKAQTSADRLATLLTSPAIRTVALAQPELAPYGQHAKDWLEAQQLYDRLSDKLVFGESINQVNQYIKSGAVEAAFTAISAMHAPALKNTGCWLPLDVTTGDVPRLDHGLVVLNRGKSPDKTVDLFLEFLNSPTAHRIFASFGYQQPS